MCKLCYCYCHDTELVLNQGTDTGNVIDAAIACPQCLNLHCDVFLTPHSGQRPRVVDLRTAEQKEQAWLDHEREQDRKKDRR